MNPVPYSNNGPNNYPNISSNNYSNINKPVKDSFYSSCTILGILFVISFLFPLYVGEKFYFINLLILSGSDTIPVKSAIVVLTALMPLLYGILMFVLPIVSQKKPLTITLFILALLPFAILLFNDNSEILASLKIYKSLWLLVISTCLMFVANNSIENSRKGNIAKILGVVGSSLFLLYLFFPSSISYKAYESESTHLTIELPFMLLNNKMEFSGIVFLIFFILLAIVAGRLIYLQLSNVLVKKEFLKINSILFLIALLVFLAGSFLAIFLDIVKSNSSAPPQYVFMALFTYLKAVIILLPHFALLYISASELFKIIESKTVVVDYNNSFQSNPPYQNFQNTQPNYQSFQNTQANNQNFPAPSMEYKACPLCNAKIPIDAKFCSTCGSTVLAYSICPNCGTENSNDAKFCKNCGNNLN